MVMKRLRSVLTGCVVAAVAAAASGCLGSSGSAASPSDAGSHDCRSIPGGGSAVVPKVVGASFDRALSRLLHHHLLVSVRHFAPFHDAMAEQGWGRLENYRVVSQSVAPGGQVASGEVVTLTLDTPEFRGPLGSMGEPIDHPTHVRIPNLVGFDYERAMAAGEASTTGIFVRVSTTGPLTPAASACGLTAFVVSSQTPRPGKQVLWGGVNPDGVNPELATVTITLKARSPATSN
jgi:hypothetical protein